MHENDCLGALNWHQGFCSCRNWTGLNTKAHIDWRASKDSCWRIGSAGSPFPAPPWYKGLKRSTPGGSVGNRHIILTSCWKIWVTKYLIQFDPKLLSQMFDHWSKIYWFVFKYLIRDFHIKFPPSATIRHYNIWQHLVLFGSEKVFTMFATRAHAVGLHF